MTRDPKKFREIARDCAVLSKMPQLPKTRYLRNPGRDLARNAASSESLHALLDRDPATDADDLSRFENYGSGVGL